MASSTGLIIVTTPGFVPPKQYLQLAYAKFPTFVGATALVKDGDTVDLVTSFDASLPPLDDFLADLEKNKDVASILYFANSKTALTDESEQPFRILLDDNGNTLLAAFIEGDYSTKQHGDSLHTDEYHVFDDVLGPQLRKIYERMCGGDIEKLDTELLDDSTEKMINQLSGNRGVVVMQSITGNVFKFEKGNDLAFEFPWAWVSNKLGFEEKSSQEYVPMEDPKKDEAPKSTKKSKFGGGPKPGVVIANSEPTKQVTNTTIAAENKETDTAVPDYADRPKISCPEHIRQKGKNHYQGWYAANTIDIGLTRDEMKNGKAAPANDDYIAKNSGKSLKDTMQHFKEKIETSKGKLPDPPIIQPSTRGIIKALLDSGDIKAKLESGRLLTKDELKEPPKHAPWSAQFGQDITTTYRWDREIIEKFMDKCMANKDPLGVVLLIEELIRENMKLLIDEAPANAKKPAVVVDVEKMDDKPDTTVVKDDPPAAKPKGNSRFAKKAA